MSDLDSLLERIAELEVLLLKVAKETRDTGLVEGETNDELQTMAANIDRKK